ncbi:MAG: glycosyltransferase [Deltaproteobacteria bacterium]|nr:glycosyltransferase [Deltaproteobacteria bacterium]
MSLVDTAKRFVLNQMVDGRLRALGKPIYTVVVAQELVAQRILDTLCGIPPSCDETLLQHLTAVVKTFERPHMLKRLIASTERICPSLKIVIADDSRCPSQISGVNVIRLPYDTGISFGRNEALKVVSTKYALIMDDDFIFYRRTDLTSALTHMERNPEIDIMGGAVVDLPLFKTPDFSKVALFPTKAEPTRPVGSEIGGFPVCDMVANFFIGRTDRVAHVGWDPRLKKMEHKDFFTRARGILTTVFNAELKCLHARTPFDKAYMMKRNDVDRERKLLRDRYSVR